MAPARTPPFALPYLVADGMTIAIGRPISCCSWAWSMAWRRRTAPAACGVNQLQLTIADLTAEAHDVHHPVAAGLYYEVPAGRGARRAADFRETRMPKFMQYFEQALDRPGDWLTDMGRWSYADLSLYHVVEGLLHAFPRRMRTLMHRYPRLMALHARVAELPELRGYLASDRRLPFGDGIFRHYPELDGA